MGAPIDYDGSAEKKAKAHGDILYEEESMAGGGRGWETRNTGSPWQTTYDYNTITNEGADAYIGNGGRDDRSYMYGRDPNAANAAAQKAWETGDYGARIGEAGIGFGQDVYGTGRSLLDQRAQDAIHFNNRAVQQGDWTTQNATLAELGGLEAAEGPSAAEAALQSGTNRALSSQVALARSGRGFGGNAAAMGQAQANAAGIQANAANEAAAIRAREAAAWRDRQARNLGTVAGYEGQQVQTDLGAAVQGRSQNDAMTSGMLDKGQSAYFAGADAGMRGLDVGMRGVGASLAGQGVANDVRGQEMTGGLAQEDNALRYVAAKNGWELGQAQNQTQQTAGYLAAGGAVLGMLSDVRAKTKIVPDRGGGADFARGLDFDGDIYRPAGMGGSNERPEDFRSSSARPSDIETEGQALGEWADSSGLTPMQQEHMGGSQTVTSGGQQIELRQPDRQALDAVREAPGSFYEYKDPNQPGAAPGRHYGPMAQDLAKTPAGASAVIKQADGSLGVDTGRLALVNTGAVSAQQQQIDDLTAQLDSLLQSQRKDGGNTNARYYGGAAR